MVTKQRTNKRLAHGVQVGGVDRVGMWWHTCADGSRQEKFDTVPACHFCGTLRREVVSGVQPEITPAPKPERQAKERRRR